MWVHEKNCISNWPWLAAFAWLVLSVPADDLSAQTDAHDNRLVSFQVVRDAPQDFGIDDVFCGTRPNFEPSRVSGLSLPYEGKDVWLKLDPAPLGWILRVATVLVRVPLYQGGAEPIKWRESRPAVLMPFSQRELATPNLALPLKGSRHLGYSRSGGTSMFIALPIGQDAREVTHGT